MLYQAMMEGIENGSHGRAMGSAQAELSNTTTLPDGRGRPWRGARPSGTACSGSCGPGRHGKIGPHAIQPIKPGIAASNTGSALGSLSGSSSLATDLREYGALARSVRFIHGTLVMAKTGGLGGNGKGGKEMKGRAMADRAGLPRAVPIAAA
jgi:hypothetical protein